MNSDEIRSAFLKFFEEKGHKVIPSSSLVPKGDPTLLLTSAGMVQVKPYFMGEAVPPALRLASCQKCFRTTDIESVGDATHLTFFEMLGNFSVGDYFKKEAIAWAWEFVTERMKISPERLWITIYLDDDESFKYWRDIGIPEEKIVRFGEEDNFWGPAGSSGPCGPCSEIHYDFGSDKGCGKPDCQPNCECGRFTELWNLVFTQYNQDEAGNRMPLPKPNIDTGMGLERLAAIMADKTSVYETDLFMPLLDCACELTGKKYGASAEDDNAMRVVAEHGRAMAFLIADGVIPGKIRRGHVLRRLLRRAQFFSETLAHDKLLLVEVAKIAIGSMKHVYPELQKNQSHILKVIESELEQFQRTLPIGRGILYNTFLKMREELRDYFPKFKKVFDKALSSNDFLDLRDGVNNAVDHFQRDSGVWEHTLSVGGRDAVKEALEPIENILGAINKDISDYSGLQINAFMDLKICLKARFRQLRKSVNSLTKKLLGYDVFILHDTYGFPVELTKEIVGKSGFTVDMEGFEREMEKQRERSRAKHKFDVVIKVPTANIEVSALEPEVITTKGTEFVGYHTLEQKAKIVRLVVDGKEADTVEAGQEAGLVLDTSPFYAEMGGQVGDTGEIVGQNGRFTVTDTVRVQPDITMHQGKVVDGSLQVGEEVEAVVDIERRMDIARNHTATHLLHSALREVLGEHIQQRGSLVAPERLRFDFSHLAAMTQEEIKTVQRIVNDKIRRNLRVYDEETDYKKAIDAGVIALFDEKYGDVVRVMRIGEPVVSAELCGGTHVENTGEIGYFHIISEGSIGAGLRRIEAVSGREAENYISQLIDEFGEIAELYDTVLDDVGKKAVKILMELEHERAGRQLFQSAFAIKQAEDLLDRKVVIDGINVLVERVADVNQQMLREMSDFIRDKLKSCIIVLGAVVDERSVFVSVVTPDLVEKGYHAGVIVERVAAETGGGGGGKTNFAQGSGKFPDRINGALKKVPEIIKELHSTQRG